MHRTENPAMSVRLRLLPHKDQIPNVGSGYSLQNYSNTGSIPVLISFVSLYHGIFKTINKRIEMFLGSSMVSMGTI